MSSLRKTFVFIGILSVLSGCSSVEERQEKALDTFETIHQTASGAATKVTEDVEALLQLTEEANKQINSLVEGIEKRVVEVQSGVQMIQKGSEVILGE